MNPSKHVVPNPEVGGAVGGNKENCKINNT